MCTLILSARIFPLTRLCTTLPPHAGWRCRPSQFGPGNLCGVFLWEQHRSPWCRWYHLPCRFPCMGQRLREHSAVSSPLSLCVSHFSKLLEDGYFRQKARWFLFSCNLVPSYLCFSLWTGNQPVRGSHLFSFCSVDISLWGDLN